jgi:hypothetical protein
MGFFSDVRALASLAEASLTPSPGASETGIRSPWAGDLTRIVLPDLLGLYGIDAPDCITRAEAMSVPGVFRARAILLTLIADKPLNAWRAGAQVPAAEAPTFLHRTPGILGPWHRMACTIDDLIFYGWSLWGTKRGEVRNGRRDILQAVHIPYHRWRVDEVTERIQLVNADGQFEDADDSEVLLIPGPSEGLLAYGSRSMQGAVSLERGWVDRALFPQALTELHLNDDTQLDDAETIATRDAYAEARRVRGGSVTVTPNNIDVIDHGSTDSAMFIEGRNASRLDIAAFFNLPGAILDATTAQASLTYVTQEGTRTSVYDLSLPYWVRPIEARLSQDDVVAAGQSVRFDFSTLAPTAPGPVTED